MPTAGKLEKVWRDKELNPGPFLLSTRPTPPLSNYLNELVKDRSVKIQLIKSEHEDRPRKIN